MLGYVCPGKVNGYPRSLDVGEFEGNLYVVYASGGSVIISTWDNVLVQVIKLGEDPVEKVTSVCLSKISGKLAVGFLTSVKLFSPHISNFKETSWELFSSLTYDSPVTSLSWFSKDELLVSGSTVSTWKFTDPDWLCTWRESSGSDLYISEISPDCNWVASSQNGGCYIKMSQRMFGSANRIQQASSFVRHPRPVVNFGWQRNPNQNGLQILYTSCTDGIFRVWAASNPNQPEQFYLCCAVEPDLVTINPDNLESNFGSESRVLQRIEDHELYHSAPFHWIDGSIVSELAKKELLGCDVKNLDSKSNAGSSNKLDHLQTIALNPPGLLYQIQCDGGLSLWKLEGMKDFPFATPKALTMARIPNAVKSKQYSSFFGTCFTAYCPISDSLDSPIEFSIIAQNADLELDLFTIGLNQAMFSDQKGGEFKLRTTWTGHESKLVRILASPAKNTMLKPHSNAPVSNSRVLALDELGKAGVWESIYSPHRLQPYCQVAMLQDQDLIRDVGWLNSDYLVAVESSRCYVYHIQDGAINSGQVFLMSSPYPLSDLSKVTIIPDSEQTHFGVVVVNEPLDQIHLWHIMLGDTSVPGSVPEIHYLSSQKLPIGFSFNSSWLINSLSYPKSDFLISDLVHLIIPFECQVQFWKLQPSLTPHFEYEWVKTNTFSTVHTCIDRVSCGPGNRIAVVSLLNRSHLISILDTRFMSFGIINEYEVEWWYSGQPISDICWMPSNLGAPLLGVASISTIYVFCQDTSTSSKKWSPKSIISVDSLPNNTPTLDLRAIDSLCIASDGSLYFSSGKYFTVCGKWLSKSEILIPHVTKKDHFPVQTFHSICQFSNPRLPYIHPDFLLEILKWGDTHLLDSIFVHLENTITHQDILSDFNSIVVPPVPLDHFVYQIPEKNQRSDSGVEALFSRGNDYQRSLSDYQISALCDGLTHCPIEGLDGSSQKRLVEFIKLFYKIKQLQNSVDGFGFRFLLDTHFQAIYFDPASPLLNYPLNSYSYLYALHSNSQDILLSECSSEYNQVIQNSQVSVWVELSRLGIAYWLQDDFALRREAEKLARVQFLKNKDPVECSLIYMALNKKRLLLSLWKTATYHPEHDVMVKFLSNDFSVSRWKTAAQRNAFKLIGRQRYEYAIAFFILGGQLKDAVGICLRYLKDPSLAFFICRCYEGAHSDQSQRLLRETILPASSKVGDRGLTSIILWWLGEKRLAIQTLSLPPLSIASILEENYSISEFGESTPSLAIYLHFRNVAINIRQEKVSVDSEVQGNLLLSTLLNYEHLGMPVLSLYSLKNLKLTPSSSDLFNHSSYTPTIPSNQLPTDNSQAAITSGQINFDDWSWGSTSVRNPTSSNLFDVPEVVDTSCYLNLEPDQFDLVRGYTYSLLHLLHRDVEDSLTSSQLKGKLPKTIVFEYLDKVKAGIQKTYSFFEFDEQTFDSSLIKWCLDSDNAILGFDLLYQGILSQEINGQQFIDALTANCLYLSSVVLKDASKSCDTQACLLWIQSVFRDYERWSVALRLTSLSTQANSQLQIIVFVMMIVYLFYLSRARDYKNLLPLLNNWNQTILALEIDLMSVQPYIKLILEEEYKNQSINFDTNQTWDLDFEIGDDLKIVYADNQKSALDIEGGCESLIQEANLFNDLISFILPSIKHFLIVHIHEPTISSHLPPLTAMLLEPILLLKKSLQATVDSLAANEFSSDNNHQRLPETFQVDPDQLFDSFHQATYFAYIRRFIEDPSHHFVSQ